MFWVKRNIQAGLASARQRYMLEDGEIPTGKKWIHKDVFGILKTLDPTNTYRYLDKICEWFWDSDEYFDGVEGEFLSGLSSAPGIFEKHKEAGRLTNVWYSGDTLFKTTGMYTASELSIYKFGKNGKPLTWFSIDVLENFRKLIRQYRDLEEIYGQSKWIIKGLNFRTVKELVDFVREGADYARAQERLIKMKPAVDFIRKEYPEQIIEDSEKAFIVKIDSYKMSSELGDKTKPREPWCVQRSMDQWLYYFQRGSCFYYLVDLLSGHQFYVQVFFTDSYTFWNDEDRPMDSKASVGIVRKLGIASKLKYFVPSKNNKEDLRIYLVNPSTLNATFGVDPNESTPDFLKGFYSYVDGNVLFLGGERFTYVIDEREGVGFLNENLDPDFRDSIAWDLSCRVRHYLAVREKFEITLSDGLFRALGVFLPEKGSYDPKEVCRKLEAYLRNFGIFSELFQASVVVKWSESYSRSLSGGIEKCFSYSGEKFYDAEFNMLMSYFAPVICGYIGIIRTFRYYSDSSGVEAKKIFNKAFVDALAHVSDELFGG